MNNNKTASERIERLESALNLRVLSLFDGMSCGRIALDQAGIKVERYYASELDKYAITVTQANWPETIQFGDVTKWREWDIDWSSIDLLIGGSPCQGFSFAGKQLAFDDPRSKLFFVYVDILNHIRSVNPDVKFLLENVKMKKEHLAVISEQLGAEPVFINSALVSAQNRQRYYWANWAITQPEDRGIVLANILEVQSHGKSRCLSTVAKDTVISPLEPGRYPLATSAGRNESGDRTLRAISEKVPPITARYYKGVKSDGAPFIYHGDKEKGDIFDYEADKLYYRKLTPIECERLQTVPDDYTAHVSNTQRYKMLGNGFTVEVIRHILSCNEWTR